MTQFNLLIFETNNFSFKNAKKEAKHTQKRNKTTKNQQKNMINTGSRGFLYHQRQTLTEGKIRLKKTLVGVMFLSLAGIIVGIIAFAYFSAGKPCNYASKISAGEQPYCRIHTTMDTGVIHTDSEDGVVAYLMRDYPPVIPPGSGGKIYVDNYTDKGITYGTILSRSYFLLPETQFSVDVKAKTKSLKKLNEMTLCVTTDKGYKHFETTKICDQKYSILSLTGTSFNKSGVVVEDADMYYFIFYSGENSKIDVTWSFHMNYSMFNLTGGNVVKECRNSSTCIFRGLKFGEYIIATYNGAGSIYLSMSTYYNLAEVYGIYLFFLLGFLVVGIVSVVIAFRSFYSPMKYISRAEILAQVNGSSDDYSEYD